MDHGIHNEAFGKFSNEQRKQYIAIKLSINMHELMLTCACRVIFAYFKGAMARH